jgi:hypothetical protein
MLPPDIPACRWHAALRNTKAAQIAGRRSDRSRLAVAPILILHIADHLLAAEQFGCVDLLDGTLQNLVAERARLPVNRALVKRGVVEC